MKRWLVIKHDSRGSPHLQWCETRAAADKVAIIQAKSHLGTRFDILEVVGTTMLPPPQAAPIIDEV